MLLASFDAELTERVEVVVAGLVADAVQVGGSEIEVELRDLDGQVEVIVIDRETGTRPAAEVPPPRVVDEGLTAVEATAASWGVERLRKPARIRRWARVSARKGDLQPSG